MPVPAPFLPPPMTVAPSLATIPHQRIVLPSPPPIARPGLQTMANSTRADILPPLGDHRDEEKEVTKRKSFQEIKESESESKPQLPWKCPINNKQKGKQKSTTDNLLKKRSTTFVKYIEYSFDSMEYSDSWKGLMIKLQLWPSSVKAKTEKKRDKLKTEKKREEKPILPMGELYDPACSADRTGICLGMDMTISTYYFGIFKIIMHPF